MANGKDRTATMVQNGHGWGEPPLSCEDGVHSWERKELEDSAYSAQAGTVCEFCGKVKE